MKRSQREARAYRVGLTRVDDATLRQVADKLGMTEGAAIKTLALEGLDRYAREYGIKTARPLSRCKLCGQGANEHVALLPYERGEGASCLCAACVFELCFDRVAMRCLNKIAAAAGVSDPSLADPGALVVAASSPVRWNLRKHVALSFPFMLPTGSSEAAVDARRAMSRAAVDRMHREWRKEKADAMYDVASRLTGHALNNAEFDVERLEAGREDEAASAMNGMMSIETYHHIFRPTCERLGGLAAMHAAMPDLVATKRELALDHSAPETLARIAKIPATDPREYVMNFDAHGGEVVLAYDNPTFHVACDHCQTSDGGTVMHPYDMSRTGESYVSTFWEVFNGVRSCRIHMNSESSNARAAAIMAEKRRGILLDGAVTDEPGDFESATDMDDFDRQDDSNDEDED